MDKVKSNDFLPKDYKTPPSRFMKFTSDKTTIRVLSSAVVGYEYWTDDEKFVRSKTRPIGTPKNIQLDAEGKPDTVKHVWLFMVYNFNEDYIQLLKVTQAQIRSGIMDLVSNEEWQDPKGYNITINRSGQGKQSRYSVTPGSKEPLDPKILKEYKALNINLDGWFDGLDPFNPESSN
jgi:hypothetical protein